MDAMGQGLINQDLPMSINDRHRGSAVEVNQPRPNAYGSSRPSNAREQGSNTSTPAYDQDSLSSKDKARNRQTRGPKMLVQEYAEHPNQQTFNNPEQLLISGDDAKSIQYI